MKDSIRDRVNFLLEKAPVARENSAALLLSYWKVYNGIEIPANLAKEIIAKGTPPESITRYRRFFNNQDSYPGNKKMAGGTYETQSDEADRTGV